MCPVRLHHAVDPEDTLEKKREHGNVELFGEQVVVLIELTDVVCAVVGRERDAGQNNLGPACNERRYDAVEVGPSVGDTQAAEAVVATELDHDDRGLHGDDRQYAGDSVLGRVAADACVDDTICVTSTVKLGLKIVRVRLTRFSAVAGRQAVAKADDSWAKVFLSSVVSRIHWDRRVGVGCCCRSFGAGRRRGRGLARPAAGQNQEKNRYYRNNCDSPHLLRIYQTCQGWSEGEWKVTEAATMIAVENLHKSIRNGTRTVDILKGISFTVPRGQFVAVMGSSGSGKSTLLGLLAGLDTPSAGDVRLNGTAISYLPEDKLAKVRGKTVGFVFQSYQLVPTLTALENVLLPYELNAEGSEKTGLTRARDLLTNVGLGDRLDHYPVQLSGGEQQRVALARAFILRPPIVMADEPTGNLDTTNGAHVLELLLNLNRIEGTTLVLVTHDPALASYADRRIMLRDGLVVSDEHQQAAQPAMVR